MSKVLVVDDEKDVREYLASILQDEQFVVDSLESGERIFSALESFQPDIVLMDYRLPGKSGVEVVRQLRRHERFRSTPIIMVTGLAGEEEKVAALELGADDYIVKPFSPKELSARIRAVLRRVQSPEVEGPERLESEGLVVDLKSHRVIQNGEEIYLTLTEFKILSELLKQQGKVLSRDRLRQTALGNLNVTDRTIDVHMASLRKKLAQAAPNIQTVRGVGYRFAT